VGLNSLKNLNLTNVYPNNKKKKKKKNNKVKRKPLELRSRVKIARAGVVYPPPSPMYAAQHNVVCIIKKTKAIADK
jgi:hypothetical protein